MLVPCYREAFDGVTPEGAAKDLCPCQIEMNAVCRGNWYGGSKVENLFCQMRFSAEGSSRQTCRVCTIMPCSSSEFGCRLETQRKAC